jgi:hypothetical protein
MFLSIADGLDHELCEPVKMNAIRLSRVSIVTDRNKSKLTYLIQPRGGVSGEIAGAYKTPVVLRAGREVLV